MEESERVSSEDIISLSDEARNERNVKLNTSILDQILFGLFS